MNQELSKEFLESWNETVEQMKMNTEKGWDGMDEFDPVRMSMMPSTFGDCETLEEILSKMEDLTLDELYEDKEFLNEFPMPTYAEMRLSFMANNSEERHYRKMETMFQNKTLIPYLKEVQRRGVEMWKKEKPAWMERWGLTEKMREAEPEKYEGLLKNLESALEEMIIKMIVEE